MGCQLSFVVFSLFFISALASLLSFHLTICNLVFEYIYINICAVFHFLVVFCIVLSLY